MKKDLKEENLEFVRRTKEAWKRYEKGEFKTLSLDKFFKELERC